MDNNKKASSTTDPMAHNNLEDGTDVTNRTGKHKNKKVNILKPNKTLSPIIPNAFEQKTNNTKITQRTTKHHTTTHSTNNAKHLPNDMDTTARDLDISDNNSDFSSRADIDDKWDINGSFIDDETPQDDMNDKWEPPVRWHDSPSNKVSNNRQELFNDIINNQRKNLHPTLYGFSTAEHRAFTNFYEQQYFLNKEFELKNSTPPSYMPLQKKLTALTKKNKEEINSELFVKNTNSTHLSNLSIDEFHQQLAKKHPIEHVKKAGLVLNRLVFNECDNDEEPYFPPVTPSLKKAYELVLNQYPLFAEIPESEHFLWLMREYTQDKKNINKLEEDIIRPTHLELQPWIINNAQTDHLSQEEFETNLEASIILFPLDKPASAASLSALQYYIENQKAIEGNEHVKQLTQEAIYHGLYEDRTKTLEENDAFMETLKNPTPTKSGKNTAEKKFNYIARYVTSNNRIQAGYPIPTEIKQIIMNAFLDSYDYTDVESEEIVFVKTCIEWFFQENNPIELEGLSVEEAKALTQSQGIQDLYKHLEYISVTAEMYYPKIRRESKNLIDSFHVPAELLFECSPWNNLKVDKESGVITNIRKTNKDLKQYIEKTYSPWVFEQLKQKLPTLGHSHMPIDTNILKGISKCLWDFGNNPKLNTHAHQNNCVSLIPFTQGHYFRAIFANDGICAPLAFEWLINQGTKNESDFTESIGYNWDSKHFKFKNQKKDDVMHRAMQIYTKVRPFKNAEQFLTIPGQGYRFESPSFIYYISQAITDLGYTIQDLTCENTKKYPEELHEAIKKSDSKTYSQHQKTEPLKIHDLTILTDLEDPTDAHAISCYYHIPNDGKPSKFKIFDPNLGEVTFKTLNDFDVFFNEFILNYYYRITEVQSLYHKPHKK